MVEMSMLVRMPDTMLRTIADRLQEEDFLRVNDHVSLLTVSEPHRRTRLMSGQWFQERIDTGTDGRIPSAEYRRRAVFAGAETNNELRTVVEDRMEILAGDFARDRKERNEQEPAFGIKTVPQFLRVVEEFMDGYRRRTGEEGVAHIYRIMLDCLDFIHDVNGLQTEGLEIQPFSEESATALLLLAACHDLPEDELKMANGAVRKANVDFIRDDNESENKIPTIRLFELPSTQEVKYRYMESIPKDLAEYLRIGLRALNTDKHDSPMDHIWEGMQDIIPAAKRLGLLPYLPALVKVFDRNDNIRTNSWEIKKSTPVGESVQGEQMSEDAVLVARPVQKIIEKCKETLTEYAPLYHYLLRCIQLRPYNMPSWIPSGIRRTTALSMRETPVILYTDLFRKYAPQWPATGMLLGKMPDELYALPPKYAYGLPRPKGTFFTQWT